MTVLLSSLLGLMVFLIGTFDKPFRGKVSIGPGSLERVYQQTMDNTSRQPTDRCRDTR